MLEAFTDKSEPNASTFINHQALQRLGIIPAGFIFHANFSADWSTAYDSVLLLDSEYPPHSARPI